MVDPCRTNEEKGNGCVKNVRSWAISLGGFEMAFQTISWKCFKIPMSVCEVRISELDRMRKYRKWCRIWGIHILYSRHTGESEPEWKEILSRHFTGTHWIAHFVNRSSIKRNIGVMLGNITRIFNKMYIFLRKTSAGSQSSSLANILFWIKEYHIDGFVFPGD